MAKALREKTDDELKHEVHEALNEMLRSFLIAGRTTHQADGILEVMNPLHSAALGDDLDIVASHLRRASESHRRATAAWELLAERAAKKRRSRKK